MSMFHVSVRHGRTQDDARARLETAVNEVRSRFGPMVQRVDWSADRDAVKVQGTGFVVEMRVDAHLDHEPATGDGHGVSVGRPVDPLDHRAEAGADLVDGRREPGAGVVLCAAVSDRDVEQGHTRGPP